MHEIIVDGILCLAIPLTRGKEAIIDVIDYPLVSLWPWRARKDRNTWYAYRYEAGETIHMHHIVRVPSEGLVTDHRNGNGLDNRRCNLRDATLSQNQQNRIHLNKRKSSRFRGVCWDKGAKSWRADLMLNQRNRYLGLFQDEVSAAMAYDAAARIYFGEFARLNFPQEPLPPGRATVAGFSIAHDD